MSDSPAVLLNFAPAEWGPALRSAAPALDLRIYPDVGSVEDIDCIITHKVQPGLLDSLPNLKLLYGVGAGVDYLIEEVRHRPALRITRIQDDAVSGDVAALAVAACLSWMRDLTAYAEHQQRAEWKRLPLRSTSETTVGILGMGGIGCTTANALRAVGLAVLGWSRSTKNIPGVATFTGDDGLKAMLARCDILVCTLPLTDDTRGLIGRSVLGALPRGSYFVNVGRGDHVVENELLEALDSGHLAGAFLDVFRQEPLPGTHALWRHPHVRVTPHVASRTLPARIAPQVVENIRRLRAGEPLMNLVDPNAGY